MPVFGAPDAIKGLDADARFLSVSAGSTDPLWGMIAVLKLVRGILLATVATSTALAAGPTVETLPVAAEDYSPMPGISGHLEVYGAGYLATDGDHEEWVWGLGGIGRVNVPFDERWNFQGDAMIDHNEMDGGSVTGLSGFGHVYWRDPNSHAIGIVGGITELIVSADGGDTEDAQLFSIGPEAQVYLDNITVYGQASYTLAEADGNSMDIFNLRGVGRYFFNPNLRLDGEVGFSWVDGDGDSVDIWSGATQLTYRLANSPVALFGRYNIDNLSSGGDDLWVHTFMAGFRTTFGAKTLLEEDRYGATMDTGSSLFSLF